MCEKEREGGRKREVERERERERNKQRMWKIEMRDNLTDQRY